MQRNPQNYCHSNYNHDICSRKGHLVHPARYKHTYKEEEVLLAGKGALHTDQLYGNESLGSKWSLSRSRNYPHFMESDYGVHKSPP